MKTPKSSSEMKNTAMEIYTIQSPEVLEAIECDGYYRPDPMSCMDNVDGYVGYRLSYRWMIDRLYEKCGLPYGISKNEYEKLVEKDNETYRVGWSIRNRDVDNVSFPYLGMSLPSVLPHPIWGFQKVCGKTHAKPDMRSWATETPQEVVRLRLEIPESRLLFSDLDYWHISLNLAYFPSGDDWEKQDEIFDARCRESGLRDSIELFSEKNNHVYTKDENEVISELQRELIDSWRGCLVDAVKLGNKRNPIDFLDIEWIERETQCVFWEIMESDIIGIERFTTRKAGKI